MKDLVRSSKKTDQIYRWTKGYRSLEFTMSHLSVMDILKKISKLFLPYMKHPRQAIQSLKRNEIILEAHKINLSSMLKDNERERSAIVKNKTSPMKLLDLPLDILREIIKEVGSHVSWTSGWFLSNSTLDFLSEWSYFFGINPLCTSPLSHSLHLL